MSPTLNVAVVQTAPRVGMVAENLAAAEEHIDRLAGRAELVLFPELFTTGYRRAGMDHAALAEAVPGGPSLERLADAARNARLAVAGTILEREGEDGRVYDTAILLGDDGRLVAKYRKTHLYPAELPYFSAGDQLVVAPLTNGLAVGLTICFEHAFPEIFTALALRGARLILIPSAVPRGYDYLLDLRTRARAQDNQVYVASANLVGFDGETRWCGRSSIVDPRGSVLAAAGGDDEEVIVATIDPTLIDHERQQEPALGHRRPELYG